jgi:mannose-6-phosphate isomerase-like protein (cupin superfamily)
MEEGSARTRLDPDSEERFVMLRRQLGVTSFGLNQLVLQPGQRSRIHRHAHQEEVYLVIEGRLSLLIEGEETELGEGELIRVAPDVRRQLLNRGPGRLVLIALGGAGEHQSRDAEAFTAWEEQTGKGPQDVPWPPDLEASELRS